MKFVIKQKQDAWGCDMYKLDFALIKHASSGPFY